ncbi:MAG: hypothetical protein IJW29_06605 [Clostridia bacterium]|nr:hypothetical protein [Clostridia bacterium]
MKMKKFSRIMAALLCVVMCVGVLAGCNKGGTAGADGAKKPEALVIMTEELDGLFNPFYSTTANDGTIVAMTQIAMLTTGVDEKGDVVVAVGDNEAVVVKAYSITEGDNDTTVYTFVLKNGIKFSDGKPLTMNDVLFNMYVYLDPVYTGSSTMYSTDIVGLKDYRTQTQGAGDSTDEALEESAATMVTNRINELLNLYVQVSNNPNLTPDYDTMVEMILAHNVTPGYKEAVSVNTGSVTSENLLADYNYVLDLFKQELAVDFESAVSNYADVKPYSEYKGLDLTDPITAFMALEGFITFEYPEVNGKEDKSVIESHYLGYNADVIKTKEAAIEFVFNNMIESSLDAILYYSRSSSTIINEYTSNAKDILLAQNRDEHGGLLIPNIEGIKSLGHNTDLTEIEVDGVVYPIAQEHNADGTVAVEGTYDVLQITINGVDPKAIWNFAFSVAPQHYYGKGQTVNIEENQFGVVYGSFDFMKNTVQANNKVPMGAGPYMATDASNNSNPSGTDFYRNNVVYFKANPHFMMGKAKIEKLRYQVVSSANALSALESGSVHFVTPQFTQNNINKINSLSSKGIQKLSTDQLGYGYIGINAGKIDNIYLRKAIMSAMDTSRALNYYSTGTAENIYWPMSTVSWAYPKTEDGELDRDNGFSYPAPNFNDEDAKAAIKRYMQQAGVSAGDSKLKIKFTIAGANMTEHPAYQVFQKAAQLLNECGWDITVVPDIQALTKLSTGSLEVWAAAWGSTVDPDMYQVYHKNSTATSTLAWGYDKIVNNSNYPIENDIINALSDVIERARETEDREERSELYKEAMGYVLDLAIELPVYQRDVLYAYDSNVIKSSSLPSTLNPYTSPLDRIWEIEFAK